MSWADDTDGKARTEYVDGEIDGKALDDLANVMEIFGLRESDLKASWSVRRAVCDPWSVDIHGAVDAREFLGLAEEEPSPELTRALAAAGDLGAVEAGLAVVAGLADELGAVLALVAGAATVVGGSGDRVSCHTANTTAATTTTATPTRTAATRERRASCSPSGGYVLCQSACPAYPPATGNCWVSRPPSGAAEGAPSSAPHWEQKR